MRARGWLLRIALLVPAAIALAAACKDVEYYVYSARHFDPDASCLDPYRPIETVSGTGAASTCEPTCFVVSGQVYTSNVCPPLPDIADLLLPDAGECLAANALYDATACGVETDGGPEPEPEAGSPPALDASVLDASDGGG